MLTKLKTYFCTQPKNGAGNLLPEATRKLNPCYAEKDLKNMWQGDVYPSTAFSSGGLPSTEVPYWMLANRTCHVFFGDKAKAKHPSHLAFIAVEYLSDYIDVSKGSVKNQVSEIIKKSERVLFLQESPDQGITSPLLVNFALVYSIRFEKCPMASAKVLQLSSPFSEHAFQKFASYFYTVGFDDSHIKDPAYIDQLVHTLESKR